MKTSILVLILFVFFSCKTNNNIENKIRNCVNSKLEKNNYIYNYKNVKIDFYKSMAKIEDILIDEKILKNKDKDSYIDFFNKDSYNYQKKIYDKLFKKLQDDGIYLDAYNSDYIICVECPYLITRIEDLPKNSSLYNQGNIGSKMDDLGEIDSELVTNLIETIYNNGDFNKIEYRAPLIEYILLTLKKQVVLKSHPAPHSMIKKIY